MAVITISHQMGSGGGDVAQAVAARLGYRFVGDEMLADAARRHGLEPDRLTRLGEAKPGFLERLGAETQTYIAVMQSAVHHAALADDVVVLGRGGQWLLRGIPHVLRVRVVAPLDVRIRWLEARLAAQTGRPPGTPATAGAVAELVRGDDRDKTGRMRYLYDRDLDDPQLYDVILNTEKGDHDGAVETICALATRPALTTTAASAQLVADRALASRARIALLTDERTRGFRHASIEATSGVVHVVTQAPADAVAAAVGPLDGAVEVRTEEIPLLPPSPMM